MSGIIKLIVVALVVTGGYFLWQSFSSEPGASEGESGVIIASDDHVKGNPKAPVVLIEYTDFQCPACGAYYPVMEQLLKDLPDKVKLVIRHYPLIQIHPNALPASRAAEAAARQGKFFEMYDVLFTKQDEWSKAADATKSIFPSYAGSIGLDVDRFKKDMQDSSLDDKINADRKSGDELDVQGTPTFILNGEKIKNPNTVEEFKTLIEAAALKAPVVTQTDASTDVVHEHVDFKVYVNNQAIDFSQDKYQSTQDGKELDEWTHLHDKVGTVIHKHKKGITLGYFFKTLGMDFSRDSLTLDGGVKLENGNGKTLKFYINGTKSDLYESYELHDLDQILVSYGSEDETALQGQIKSVSNDACIYSEKCPERGPAPTEECVGGLGTDCK